MPEAQANPLEEAIPTSLDELFSRDPLKLGEQDIITIVVELRRMRKNFAEAEAKPAKPKKLPKAAPLDKAIVAQLSLDDLGI